MRWSIPLGRQVAGELNLDGLHGEQATGGPHDLPGANQAHPSDVADVRPSGDGAAAAKVREIQLNRLEPEPAAGSAGRGGLANGGLPADVCGVSTHGKGRLGEGGHPGHLGFPGRKLYLKRLYAEAHAGRSSDLAVLGPGEPAHIGDMHAVEHVVGLGCLAGQLNLDRFHLAALSHGPRHLRRPSSPASQCRTRGLDS